MAEKKEQKKEDKIQELRMLEQNLQSIMMQRQAFQMELNETKSSLEEVKNSGEDVFKIVGQLMIKTEKGKIEKELSEKVKILELRLSNLEKQEGSMAEKFEDLRKETVGEK